MSCIPWTEDCSTATFLHQPSLQPITSGHSLVQTQSSCDADWPALTSQLLPALRSSGTHFNERCDSPRRRQVTEESCVGLENSVEDVFLLRPRTCPVRLVHDEEKTPARSAYVGRDRPGTSPAQPEVSLTCPLGIAHLRDHRRRASTAQSAARGQLSPDGSPAHRLRASTAQAAARGQLSPDGSPARRNASAQLSPDGSPSRRNGGLVTAATHSMQLEQAIFLTCPVGLAHLGDRLRASTAQPAPRAKLSYGSPARRNVGHAMREATGNTRGRHCSVEVSEYAERQAPASPRSKSESSSAFTSRFGQSDAIAPELLEHINRLQECLASAAQYAQGKIVNEDTKRHALTKQDLPPHSARANPRLRPLPGSPNHNASVHAKTPCIDNARPSTSQSIGALSPRPSTSQSIGALSPRTMASEPCSGGTRPVSRRDTQEGTRHANAVHAIIPAWHKGFELGGRNGNIVVKTPGGPSSYVTLETGGLGEITVPLERGWKAVGFNFERCSARAFKRRATKARLEGKECYVTFEVTKSTVARLGRGICRQADAKFKLEEALGFRTLEELDRLPRESKADLLRDVRVLRALVDTKAVSELDILLGTKCAIMLRLSLDVRRAIRHDTPRELEMLLESDAAVEALLQRDGGGNVPLHYCKSVAVARLLDKRCPEAKFLKNARNQLPLHCCLEKMPEDVSILQMLMINEASLLELDADGISPAMLGRGTVRSMVEEVMPSWRKMQAALQCDCKDVLQSLDDLKPQGLWPTFMSYHCFSESEVWKDGRHTPISSERLQVVWRSIAAALTALNDECDDMAARAARELLTAIKGPCHEKLDPREPYRAELAKAIRQLEIRSADSLKSYYSELATDSSAGWLMAMPDDVSSMFSSTANDILGVPPQVQFRLEPPSWLAEPDMETIMADLKRQGIIGAARQQDAAYDLFRLADASQWHYPHLTEDDLVLARWYVAWLRAVCLDRKDELTTSVCLALCMPEGSNEEVFQDHCVPDSFDHVCEKIAEQLKGLSALLRDQPRPSSEFDEAQKSTVQMLTRQAGSFICDVNRFTHVVGSTDELRTLHESLLQSSSVKVAKTQNGFSSAKKSPTSFRDLKVFVECQTERGPLVVEVQLCLHPYWKEKVRTDLCDQLFDGSFDWPHIFQKWMGEARQAARRDLEDAIFNGGALVLFAAISQAERMGLEERRIDIAEKLLARQSHDSLRKAMKMRMPSELRNAITASLSFIAHDTVLEEAEGCCEQLERAEDELKKAVAKKRSRELRICIEQAQACQLNSGFIEVAQHLLEEKMRSCLKNWSGASEEESSNIADVAAILSEARDAGLEASVIEEIDLRLRQLQVHEAIAQAMEMDPKDPHDVRKAIEDAHELGESGPDVWEAEDWLSTMQSIAEKFRENASREREPYEPEETLADLLYSVAKQAIVQDLQDEDEEEDEEATRCAEYKAESEGSVSASAQNVPKEALLDALNNARRNSDPAALRKAIACARQGGIRPDCTELINAEQSLEDLKLKMAEHLNVVLQKANTNMDLAALREAIAQAEHLDPNNPDLIAAKDYYSRQHAAEHLQSIMATGTVTELADVVSQAQADIFEVEPWLLEAAQNTLAQLRQVPQSLRKAMEARDPSGLRDLLGLADRAGIARETIRQGEKLFADMQTEVWDKLQKATQQRCLADLLVAVSGGRAVGLQEQYIVAAETVVEELHLAAQDLLQEAITGAIERTLEEFIEDVANARLAGVEESILEAAEQKLSKRKQVFQNINASIATGEVVNVRTAISRGRKAQVPMIDLKIAYKWLNEIKGIALERLKSAIDSKDVNLIPSAMADARKAACDEKDLKDATWFLQKLTHARASLKTAIKDGNSTAALHNAISNVRTWGLEMSEIEEAEAILERHKERALRNLRDAMEHRNRADLLSAVAEVESSAFVEDNQTNALLKKSRDLLSELHVWSTEKLRVAMKARSVPLLEEALAIAWGNAVAMDLITEAKDLHNEIVHSKEYRQQHATKADQGKPRKVALGQGKHIYDLEDSNSKGAQAKQLSVQQAQSFVEDDDEDDVFYGGDDSPRRRSEHFGNGEKGAAEQEFEVIRESLRARASKASRES